MYFGRFLDYGMELWGIIFGKEIQFVENFEIVGCALL
jgi:hypothetical protein